jgi:hypothetical protein
MVSVLVENKREDKYQLDSEIHFSHNYIMKFLEHHHKYVVEEEIIKIFILGRRFRLTLQFMNEKKSQFQIEFF